MVQLIPVLTSIGPRSSRCRHAVIYSITYDISNNPVCLMKKEKKNVLERLVTSRVLIDDIHRVPKFEKKNTTPSS